MVSSTKSVLGAGEVASSEPFSIYKKVAAHGPLVGVKSMEEKLPSKDGLKVAPSKQPFLELVGIKATISISKSLT